MANFVPPIFSLNEDLNIEDFLKERRVDFEIESTVDEEDHIQTNSVESYFEFEKIKDVINFDLLDDESDESAPFDKYRRKMFKLQDDGKILKHIVKQGVGPLPESNCTIYIRYQAYIEYGEVPFDSTLAQSVNHRDCPLPYNLADSGLLPGLHLALLSMKKGEKAEFLVHPDLAFGRMGCPPRIPPEATILFVVEVNRFGDEVESENITEVPREDRKKYPYLYKIALKYYQLGNNLFKENNYTAASKRYSTIIRLLNGAHFANEEEELDCGRFLIKIYTNLCVCCLKLKNHKRLCVLAAEAMKCYQNEVTKNHKLLYLWGRAKMGLADYKAARKHFLAANRLKPNDPDIKTALKDLDYHKRKMIDENKIMAATSFGLPPDKKELDYHERKIIDENKIMASTSFGLPPDKKEHKNEIDEDRFWKIIGGKMQDLINDTAKYSLVIEEQLSPREVEQSVQLAKDLGLSVHVGDGSNYSLHISKSAHMFP